MQVTVWEADVIAFALPNNPAAWESLHSHLTGVETEAQENEVVCSEPRAHRARAAFTPRTLTASLLSQPGPEAQDPPPLTSSCPRGEEFQGPLRCAPAGMCPEDLPHMALDLPGMTS